jgi:hypothetical protein
MLSLFFFKEEEETEKLSANDLYHLGCLAYACFDFEVYEHGQYALAGFTSKVAIRLPIIIKVMNLKPPMKKILFSYMIFVKGGLTPCAIFKNISALSWQSNG